MVSAPRCYAGLCRSRSLQAALVAVVVGLAAVVVPLSAKRQRGGPVAPVAVSAVVDGLNHFVVQMAGSSVAPSANDQDPIVLAPGRPKGEYLARLASLERELPAADLGSVYRAPDGTVRLHLLSASPVLHEAQIAAYRRSLNTRADPAAVRRLMHTPGIAHAHWFLPGAVAVATSLSQAQVAALAGVKGVAVDATVTDYAAATSPAPPDDPYFSLQWGLDNTGQDVENVTGVAGDDIHVLAAWSLSTGAGVNVAVVDDGAQSDHPDLVGAFSPASGNVLGETGFDPTAGAVDYGHGTHVTGIIAARTDNGIGTAGVAPGVTIVEEKASDGGSLLDSNVAQAIYAALSAGAKIINLSLGGTTYDPTLEAAIQQAQADGALVVCAAGNSGQDNDPSSPNPLDNTNPDTVYPASLPEPNIISVGASTSNDTMASFSNYGPNSVDLFAPGDNIASTYPGSQYAYMSGTSMATPMVAGVAALVWSRNPSLTYAQVKADLMDTVTKVPALGGDAISAGVLNAYAAVAAANAPVSMTFNGFGSVVTGATTAANFAATGTVSGLSSSTPLSWRISLGYDTASGPQAVTHEPITIGSGASAVTLTTDANGEVVTSPSGLTAGSLAAGVANVPLSADYPWSGTYALTASLVPSADPTAAAYTTQAVFFTASAAAAPPVATTTTAPSGTSGTSPTTTSPPASSTATTTSAGPQTTAPATTTSLGPVATTSPAPSSTLPAATTTTAPPSAPTSTVAPTGPTTTSPPPVTVTTSTTTTTTTTTTMSSTTSTSAPATTTSLAPTTTTLAGTTTTIPMTTGDFGLTAVTPSSGSSSGGDLVTVYGSAIPPNSGVLIGGVAAEVTSDNSPTSLTVVVGPHAAGTVDVEVISPTGTSQTLRNAFTFLSSAGAPPTSTTTTTTTPSGTTTSSTPVPTSTTAPSAVSTTTLPASSTTSTTTAPATPATLAPPTATTSPTLATTTTTATPTTTTTAPTVLEPAPNGATLGAVPPASDLALISSDLWSMEVTTSPARSGIVL